MSRTTYLVTYDICDPKRLREVYHVCRSYGEHLQYSVFRCDLTPLAKARLVADIDPLLNHHEDQVLFVSLGPSGADTNNAFESLGRPFEPTTNRARIL